MTGLLLRFTGDDRVLSTMLIANRNHALGVYPADSIGRDIESLAIESLELVDEFVEAAPIEGWNRRIPVRPGA
jgi:hypothetical protein